MYKVSIIMPCLNVVSYFKECIESVINQTISDDLEIIIIDAGSVDGTYEMASFYEQGYDNVRLLESDRKSYGYQVNIGIREARAKYIAVLETDDYVRNDMYELLFNKAEEFDADYVKGDYKTFYQLKLNSNKLFEYVKLFKDNSLYNRVIDVATNRILHLHDYCIWKGIYRRDFLVKNNIFLNESLGAAYQDIGFGMLLHSCSHRALYIPDLLYRYRIGRPSASVNSGKGISYSAGEFRRLFDMAEEYSLFLEAVYEEMLASFCGEFYLLENYNALEDDRIIDDSKWLINKINEGIEKGIITIDNIREDGLEQQYETFQLISKDLLGEMKKQIDLKTETKKWYMSLSTDGCSHIIFGAGNYGRELLLQLDKYDVRVKVFFDNSAKDGDTVGGIDVVKPNMDDLSGDVKVIIANKYHKEDIRKQLLEMGVDAEDILEYK